MGINPDYTGTIQKYIGTAYDAVALVAGNIASVLNLSTAIDDGSFQQLIDISDDLTGVVASIDQFNGTYYGALASDPGLDPLGNAITVGDMYWNSTDGYMRVAIEIGPVVWEPMGAIQKSVEAQTISAAMAASGVVSLENPYIPGQNNLMVFIDGVHATSKTAEPLFGIYIETNGTTLTFDIGAPFLENSEIVVVIGVEVSTVKHVVDIETGIYNTVVPNEQEITLPNNQHGEPMVYIVGDSNMDVYLDRRLMLPVYDYVETSPVKITFNVPLQQNQELYFKKGSVISDESGVQQILTQDATPGVDDYANGQLWLKTDTSRLYVLYADTDAKQWIGLTNEDTVIVNGEVLPPSGPPGVISTQGVIMQDATPDPSTVPEGTFWMKTNTGDFFVMYYDNDSAQWLQVNKK